MVDNIERIGYSLLMPRGTAEINSALTFDNNAIAFKSYGHFLIIESNTDGTHKASYVIDSSGELVAMFNDLDLAANYLLSLVAPLILTR